MPFKETQPVFWNKMKQNVGFSGGGRGAQLAARLCTHKPQASFYKEHSETFKKEKKAYLFAL